MAKKHIPNQKAEEKTKERINFLVNQIEHHRELYYNKTPELSDAKYDLLEDELKKLDPNNPVFSIVGADGSEIFTKRSHIIPMGSQEKVTNPEDFIKWVRKRNLTTMILQYKLDGISIELQYKTGVFQCAITRGDGKIGDDVTQNVMKMKGFVPKLKSRFTGATRAEILLFHEIYEKKYADKQNCRNAAGGIVRRKDGKGCEDLDLVFYDAISIDEKVQFEDEIKKIKWLKQESFPTVENKVVMSSEEVIQVRKEMMNSLREKLTYDIDGLVIKANEIDLEDMKRARPMKQIAFKFRAEEIESRILAIEWSVSGHIYTPVAIIEKVRLMGSNIGRASLANPNLIKELGLKIGSEVMISKRGDIIPKIERVLKTPSDASEVNIPHTCEVCKTELVNEGTRLFCPNEMCPKRNYHRLVKWIKKLGVKNFSEKLMLRKLFDSGKIKHISDLYSLEISDLIQLDGVKETSAKKALTNLFTIKEIPLAKFVAGFNIENVGERVVEKAVKSGFDTLDKLNNATHEQLSKIDGYAEITAHNLLDGLNKMYPDMQILLSTNKIKIKSSDLSMSKKLEGITFCFTGKLETMKRPEAEQLVAENGGESKSNVVKNLTYLVTNDTTQTGKYKKAQSQNTKIITEKEFIEMIKG